MCADDEAIVCETRDDPRFSFCDCVPVQPITCANVLCAPDTVCVETSR
jgi:hypothetical protein